jgi:hypothetical protein
MTAVDALGYLASLLVLATFCMRGMVALRLMAIASNLAFIGYAAMADIHPVLLLHALLLPMNAWRLLEIGGSRRRHVVIALTCCGIVGAVMAGPADGAELRSAPPPAPAASAPSATSNGGAAPAPSVEPDWRFTPRHRARAARR